MRKLLALLVLVPFAAIVVLSCDDHPTAPEEVQAATAVQESSTPQASTKAPTLPTPVTLAGYSTKFSTVTLDPGETKGTYAWCPLGKVPIAGGFDCIDMEPRANSPASEGYNGEAQLGWYGACTNTTGSVRGLTVRVICIDGSDS